ncbi:hypothetical protein LTR99_009491 [Exophiala xenobiotica]|uniref:CysZ protein n=1 Tax=Vermiconidia calcicola TaxID=1690605 RepID=A0AAV9PZ82_9PEZI|nr:hypothetical protein LTR41_004078 [Exophiala xenobiotica]KAK5530835.1 hypothetical protein LTR25_008692 [Vermiconidia calcicola]KAK5531230.1 hypothetical protein LTR23_009997 [Chaetothyriales sp. CCFEE 6169]KAK5228376.1 hypothetical protein LTR72_002259 [Exophiala xenobiotica]KAK5268952.1 hypothetical protein LTR96_005736 [Exophiala xenobiotica]
MRNSWVDPIWLYPLKGIYYFIRHPYFYPLFKARMIPILFLSAFIYTNLFIWTYLPQVAFLALFQGPGAWLNATFLVLGEGAAIVALLFEAFFVDEKLVDIFDAVLIDQGLADLVKEARLLDQSAENSVQMLGKPTISSVYSPFSLRQILEFVILLPVNFIPFVGVPIFLFLTGYRAGPFHHWRYFKLLGFSKKERTDYIRKRQLKYTWFGTVALALQLVPVLSMFFLLTTAAGSALWVASMEKARRSREAVTPSTVEQYQDDPA